MNSQHTNQLKILLADGDDALRSLLQEYLKRLDYEVFSAGNGREAVDIARKKKPHLIILEISGSRRMKSNPS